MKAGNSRVADQLSVDGRNHKVPKAISGTSAHRSSTPMVPIDSEGMTSY